jgi:hypothetical protein
MRTPSLAIGLLWAATSLLGAAPSAQAAPACDRACLEGAVGDYLSALAARDPRRLPGSQRIRFVENAQPLKIGEGTWGTVDGLGTYRHVFADPQAGQVAAITTVKEHGVLAILDVSLKIQGGKIVEAESQIIRDPMGAARYETLGAPEALWMQAVPPADRISREALIATANKYFQGMQRNDPKGDYSFFDPDCNRLEHGVQTTNLRTPEAYGHSNDTAFSSLTCEQQFQTGFLGFVTELRDRRFVVVDEERQEVFAFVDLDHNGTVRTLPSVNGTSSPIPLYFNVPRGLRVGEAFRMRRDKIHRIEMTLTEIPYGMRPPGDGSAPVPTNAKPARGRPSCDRDCLRGLLTGLLQAMIDHDPSGAALSPTVRYTENGQALKIGDGFWGTVSAIAVPGDGLLSLGPKSSAYKLMFADPTNGQAAYFGAVNEQGTPGMMTLRIGVEGGKIAQIEAVIVREEYTGPRSGTVALFRPKLLAELTPAGFDTADQTLAAPDGGTARAALQAAADRYFDALKRGQSSRAALAADCERRDNGVRTTGRADAPPLDIALPAFKPFALGCAAQIDSGFFGYLTGVRARRAVVADDETGLVLVVAMLDHAGTVKTLTTAEGQAAVPPELSTPSTDLVAAVFKVKDGRISRIETIQRPMPFGAGSGWTN